MGPLSRRRFRPFLAAFLAALIACEPVAAALSEATFWRERRGSSGTRSRVEMAGLPAPALIPLGAGRRPAVLPPAASLKTVEQALASLPWSLGRVSKRTPAAPRTVIHIQDVHLNPEAQSNISAAIAALLPWAGGVAIEGEWGPLRLNGFRGHARADHLRLVADYLLGKSTLDGALHALLTADRDVPVIGADDRDHYAANVEAYRRAMRTKAQAAQSHRRRGRALAEETAALSPELRALMAQADDYHAARLALGAYLESLRKRVTAAPAAVDDFLRAFKLEKAINLDATARERRSLIEELARRLDPVEIDDLMTRSLAYKAGTDSAAGFYAHLQALCARNGIRLSRYPAMSSYLAYVLVADRIDPSALQAAVADLERAAVDALVRNERDRAIVGRLRRHRLEGKLLALSLTPAEWAAYKTDAGRDAVLSPFEDFYREAERRDEAMARRLGDFFARESVGAVILVTGGFHAAGLRSRLAKKGIGIIEWTPRLTKIDEALGARALDVFTQEKAPLESIFEGRKLFLTPRPSRSLPRAAAALLALDEISPEPGATRASPELAYHRLLPGAGAKSVDVRRISPSQAVVTVETAAGVAEAEVGLRPDGELEISEAKGAPRAAAMSERTEALGRRLGLTREQAAVDLAPVLELPHTLLDYVFFAVITSLTIGFVRPDYFLELHDNRTAEERADRARGIRSIRIHSTVALVLSAAAFIGIEFATGGGAEFLGTTWLAHVVFASLLVVPSVAWAQVRAHRAYNRWAIAQAHKPTLTLDEQAARNPPDVAVRQAAEAALARLPSAVREKLGEAASAGLLAVAQAELASRRTLPPAEEAALREHRSDPRLSREEWRRVIIDVRTALTFAAFSDSEISSRLQTTWSARWNPAVTMPGFIARLRSDPGVMEEIADETVRDDVIFHLERLWAQSDDWPLVSDVETATLRRMAAELKARLPSQSGSISDEALFSVLVALAAPNRPELHNLLMLARALEKRAFNDNRDLAERYLYLYHREALPTRLERRTVIEAALRLMREEGIPERNLDAEFFWEGFRFPLLRPTYSLKWVEQGVERALEDPETAVPFFESMQLDPPPAGGEIGALLDLVQSSDLHPQERIVVARALDAFESERIGGWSADDRIAYALFLNGLPADGRGGQARILAILGQPPVFSRLVERIRANQEQAIDLRALYALTGAPESLLAPDWSSRPLTGHDSQIKLTAFSPDSRRIVIGTYEGTIREWDAAIGEEIRSLTARTEWVDAAAFSPEGRWIAGESHSGNVSVWDTVTGEVVRTLIGHFGWVGCASFSPDGRQIVTGGNDGTARVWDLATGEAVHVLIHTDWVMSVAFSPDGRTIVTGDIGGAARVWDAATGEEIHSLESHYESVSSVAFSPDGGRIATGSYGFASIWDSSSGEIIHTLIDPSDWVVSLAFSPDGERIVTGSHIGGVRLWDVATGEEIRKLDGHFGRVESVAFSPDGRWIVSGNDEGTAWVWNLPVSMWRKTPLDVPTAMMESTRDYGRSRGFSDEETAIRIAPWFELPYTLLDYALFLTLLVFTFGNVPTNQFLDRHRHQAEQDRVDRARGIASIRFWSTVALVLSGALFVAVELMVGGSISELGTIAGPAVHAVLGGVLVLPSLAWAQARAHRAYNRWAVASGRATLTISERASIPGMDEYQLRFVAAAAHAYRKREEEAVPAAAVNEARDILLGETPLPGDMWQAAFDFMRFRKLRSFVVYVTAVAEATFAADADEADRFFGPAASNPVVKRAQEKAVLESLIPFAAVVIDERDPRPVMPERLRAESVAVYSATKGNYEVKSGLRKDRNEDFGLHFILPDGSILMFTADGMGGYGHGDQAAQLAAAAFMRELMRFWESANGNEAALTDVDRLEDAFESGRKAALNLIRRDLANTSAGVVFEFLFAHPRAAGGWFVANYHRGDARTEIGEAGKPLRPASIDNDTSGIAMTLDDVEVFAAGDSTFRFLRSVASEDDLVHEKMSRAFRSRSSVSGGLIEGFPDDFAYAISYGDLPDGAFVLQSTDGRLDPLTEAESGRVVAASGALADVPQNLIDASQPDHLPGEKAARPFRAKPDDALNQIAALGPRASIERGSADEEQALNEASELAEAAIDALTANDREAAREFIKRAAVLMSGVPEQRRARVAATRAFVRGVEQIVTNTAVYFATGERLLNDGADIGYVVDDGRLLPGRVILMNKSADRSAGEHEFNKGVAFRVMNRDDLTSRFGAEITRDAPSGDYFEQRQEISAFGLFLESARERGVELRDGDSLADVQARLVNREFPDGTGVHLVYQSFVVLQNGASADSYIPGFAILYFDQIDEIGFMSHQELLGEDVVETADPSANAERLREARDKMARAYAESGGLTVEGQRTRFMAVVEGNSWDEFGHTKEEIDAMRGGEAQRMDRLWDEAATGDEIVTDRGTLLVIDKGAEETSLEPGNLLVYRYDDAHNTPLLLAVERRFFDGVQVIQVRKSGEKTQDIAAAARDHVRALLAQPGKNLFADVDELPWEEVMPATLGKPGLSAMATRGTRRLARRLFGWEGPRDEGKIRLLAVFSEIISSSVPVLHVFLHDNRGGLWLERWLKHGLILAGTWALPIFLFGSPTIEAVLAAAAGNVVAHFLVSVLPWIAFGRSQNAAPRAADVDAESLIASAFPDQEPLGLGTFTFESLPLLGMTPSQADALAQRIRGRYRVDGSAAAWDAVQRTLVARLAGERTALGAIESPRLALAAQGGSDERRREDARLVRRLLAQSPNKEIVLFIDGSSEEDRFYFALLARRSGGRVKVIEHVQPLIRERDGGRILDLAALEAALAASEGAWEGAAFVIPADLAFDAGALKDAGLLRRLAFLFLDQSLRALQAEAPDLRNIDLIARVIAQQA